MRFIVLTFSTEGPPHDHGVNLTEVEQGFRRHVEPHADVYLAYTPRRLVASAPDSELACRDYSPWLERHPERSQLGNFNPSWARVGFQMWKPHLLEHVIGSQTIADGDLVLYHDVNFHRYPVYVHDCAQWRALSLELLRETRGDVFVPQGNPMKRDVKSCLIRKYLGDHAFDSAGVWNGLILIRKSRDSLEFLREWKEMSSQLDNISPLPDHDPHREFVWHSVDQSTMGVLAQIWRESGRLPMDWPRYEVRGRHFAKENIVRGNRPVQEMSQPLSAEKQTSVPSEERKSPMTSVEDSAHPELGGNLRYGDIQTFHPVLWRYLVERYAIRSLLDVGCGEGHAVAFFRGLGVHAHGIDGLKKNVDRAVVPIALHNLLDGPYYMPVDMVWSCEVAEHIAPEKVDHFLNTLANGAVVAMTAAPPGQGGYHHVNCQPSEYWIKAMAARGYRLSDDLGIFRQIAGRECSAVYFSKSGLVFVRD